MIKFFRKIRQTSIFENKFGNYLIYAIGELILVVIGILIALQINNCNEQRNSDKQELLLLKQLQIDIKTNLDEVVELNQRLSINKFGIDSLVNRLSKKQYHKKVPFLLSQSLRKSEFTNASSGYNLMQNGKASLISDETILKQVLELYENDFPNIMSRQNDMKNSIDFIQTSFVNKLFIKQQNQISIKFKKFDEVATEFFVPIDYDALTENIEFKNNLIQLGKLVETRLAYLKKTEDNLSKTLSLLNLSLTVE